GQPCDVRRPRHDVAGPTERGDDTARGRRRQDGRQRLPARRKGRRAGSSRAPAEVAPLGATHMESSTARPSRPPLTPESRALAAPSAWLAEAVVRQLPRTAWAARQRDEWHSEGLLAVVLAAADWRPDRGVPFEKFAAFRARCAVTDAMRSALQKMRRARVCL